MRKYLLATVSGLALASTAQAADLRTKAPAQVIPVWNWTGWYIGAHAGALWHEATNNDLSGLEGSPASNVTNHTGFIYGGQIGYNWQSNHLVWGIEADISGVTGRARKSFYEDGDPTDPELEIRNRIDWLGTVRLRMGLAVQNTMAYVTGGLAYGRVKNVFDDVNEFCSPPPSSCGLVVSESKVRWGWTAGGGIEHMWSPNWSIKAEALFVDLGRSTASTLDDPKVHSIKFSNKAVIGRIGINYRWGGAR